MPKSTKGQEGVSFFSDGYRGELPQHVLSPLPPSTKIATNDDTAKHRRDYADAQVPNVGSYQSNQAQHRPHSRSLFQQKVIGETLTQSPLRSGGGIAGPLMTHQTGMTGTLDGRLDGRKLISLENQVDTLTSTVALLMDTVEQANKKAATTSSQFKHKLTDLDSRIRVIQGELKDYEDKRGKQIEDIHQ